jgi:hypothetical protein
LRRERCSVSLSPMIAEERAMIVTLLPPRRSVGPLAHPGERVDATTVATFQYRGLSLSVSGPMIPFASSGGHEAARIHQSVSKRDSDVGNACPRSATGTGKATDHRVLWVKHSFGHGELDGCLYPAT